MKSYKEVFAAHERALLIPFFVLGDPDEGRSLELIKAAIDAGADILELGVPFSDPIADGPTIQRADIRALQQQMTCSRALHLVQRIKAYRDIPLGLLMYCNLIYHYGPDAFYRDAAAAGVNSVLVADLCEQDVPEVAQLLQRYGLDSVFMVTPNTTAQRRRWIARQCTGFVYTVSLMGVTGARARLSAAVKPLIKTLQAETEAPICVGFGVSKPEHARALAQAGADGVIVGSAVVDVIERHLDAPDGGAKELTAFIQQLRSALNGARG